MGEFCYSLINIQILMDEVSKSKYQEIMRKNYVKDLELQAKQFDYAFPMKIK